jgi:hypothetical protein
MVATGSRMFRNRRSRLLTGFIQAFERAEFKHRLVWLEQQMVLGRCGYDYRQRADFVRMDIERPTLR